MFATTVRLLEMTVSCAVPVTLQSGICFLLQQFRVTRGWWYHVQDFGNCDYDDNAIVKNVRKSHKKHITAGGPLCIPDKRFRGLGDMPVRRLPTFDLNPLETKWDWDLTTKKEHTKGRKAFCMATFPAPKKQLLLPFTIKLAEAEESLSLNSVDSV